MKLNDKACRNAKVKDRPYKMADGGGLYLLVKPDGAKYWRLKYRWLGKEKLQALGVYPLITLAEAREDREATKKLLKAGVDPVENQRDVKRAKIRNAKNAFEIVAREWHENQKGRWTSDHAANVLHRLEVDVFPHLGKAPISSIRAPDLLECLRKIEKRGALEIAGRAKQICGQVFRYGIQTGVCDRDPSADLKGALQARKVKHFAAINAQEIPKFIQTLARNDARLFARTRRAIALSMLTFTRPGELRQAAWSEIDFDQAEWHIPAERMKTRQPHLVPLSAQAVAIFKEQRDETGHLNTHLVFPSQIRPRQPMSDGTVNRAIKKLGYSQKMTAHGFRALARTTIREQLGYDSEVIEKQLAHKTQNSLGEAYDRTQFLSQRREMMQSWADYLDEMARTGKVIRLPIKRVA